MFSHSQLQRCTCPSPVITNSFCEKHSDCAGSLKCLKRSGFKKVPGCSGDGVEGGNYCYNPWSSPTKQFKLKQYWQSGYFWQERSSEPQWCLTCTDSNCIPGATLELLWCSKVDTKFSFAEADANGMVKIQIHSGDDVYCVRGAGQLQVEYCNTSTKAGQLKFLPGLGDFFNGDKFELQKGWAKSWCANNEHHPKSGEIIGIQRCSVARQQATSYWIKY